MDTNRIAQAIKKPSAIQLFLWRVEGHLARWPIAYCLAIYCIGALCIYYFIGSLHG